LDEFEFDFKDIWNMRSLVNQDGDQGNYLSGGGQGNIDKENYLVPNKF
jgi:hypothetical protein